MGDEACYMSLCTLCDLSRCLFDVPFLISPVLMYPSRRVACHILLAERLLIAIKCQCKHQAVFVTDLTLMVCTKEVH